MLIQGWPVRGPEDETGAGGGGIDMTAALADIDSSLADFGVEQPGTDGSVAGGDELKTVEGTTRPADDETADDATEVEKAPEAKAPEAAPAVDPNDKPPDTWTKPAKEAWAKVPAEVKADIRKREGDMAEFVQRYKGVADVGQAMVKAVTPYADQYTQRGLSVVGVLPALVQGHATLAFGTPAQKLEVLQAIAEGAGIDLGAFARGDPAAASNEVARLNARIQQLEGGVTGVTTAIQRQEATKMYAQVDAFVNAVDDKGQPKYPHIDAVYPEMQQLLESKQAKTLEEAYDKAIFLNPVTRQVEIDRKAQAVAESKAAENQAKVEKARQARQSSVRTTGSGSRGAPKGSWEESLAETYNEITSRG